MPHQVDGAFVRAPCPVPSCPACEPNSGSVFPSLSTRAHSSRGGPALLCNQVQSQYFKFPITALTDFARSIKGKVNSKYVSGDWKERGCSLCFPAQVMLRGSWVFALRRSILFL